ncbi:dihydroxy-acid dehydratase domain-containing protein, partial [Streptomyces ardesiacus]
LGMQLPGSAAWPAVDSRRMETAQAAGQRIVEMVEEELRPSRILTREAFENAVRVNAAIGGSTNAIIHLTALAGRVGVELSLPDFDGLARAVPTLVNLMPSGTYLMEDFCYAGGLPAVLAELLGGGLLHGDQITVTGRTVAEDTEHAERVDSDVITRLDAPFQPAGTGIAVLRGNLCPDGAVIKQSAASPHLLTHRGPARVFDSPEAYHEVADDPHLDIDENTVIVIRNAGPQGYPGMPEVANVPLPAKLLKAGVTDMVRVCDGRMSGTGYGTVVLHVAPEAAVGGPLALVHDGDPVVLDVPNRTLRLDVDDAELARRRQAWRPRAERCDSGYTWLYRQNVEQADRGADFGFLRGSRGHEVPRDSH